ncbi:TonB-dependent receptor [Maricaulis virginensis]|uniref:TonB-dependent receptor n=1 Tax=Maricaulis virginensis TaxID=144022 RepID=A0A9W6IQA8_9PROT|nr:TonB-dependent receptor [Maricaulis virginensis]GLK53250.1 TonB-dependent receptor [Maricaulis virginensis]
MAAFNKLLASTALAGSLTFATLAPAFGQDVREGEDLAAALNRVANTQNVEILYSPDVVAGKHAGSVSAGASPEAMLQEMLAGTGLAVQQTRPDVFVVTDPPETGGNARTPAATRTGPEEQEEAATFQETGAPGSIEGRLTDRNTGTGLAGAVIRLANTSIRTVTDQRGFYRMPAVPPGNYEIVAEYVGAGQESLTIRVGAGEEVDQDFTLNPSGAETIVVLGNRGGFLQALNQQRNAENNQTVISADLLGTFPAESVAEALRRVPGISFERDSETGEGDRVSVRGITSEAINIQLNGLQLQGTGIERAVDLTGYLADNISQITIQKSLLPENEGTANGGLIEIETRSALDYGERHFSVGAEHEMPDGDVFGNESQYNASAVFQINDRIGIGGNVQYRNSDRRNFDVAFIGVDAPVLPAGYTSFYSLPYTYNFPFDEALPDRLITGANHFIRDRSVENMTGSVFAAWDVNDSTRLRAEYQHISNEDTSSVARMTSSTLTSSTDMPIPELGGEERRRTYIRALRPTMGIADSVETTTTDVFSVRGDTVFDRWTFEYKAGYSNTTRDISRTTIATLADINTDVFNLLDPGSYVVNPDANGTDRIVGGVVDFYGDGIPALALSQAGRELLFDPDTHYVTSATENEGSNSSELFTAAFDVQYDFVSTFLSSMKAGVKYDDSSRTNSDDVLSTNAPTAFYYSRTGSTRQGISEFGGGIFGDYDFGVIGAGGLVLPSLRSGSARTIFDGVAAYAAANPGSYRVTDNRVDPRESAGALSTARTDETRLAAYLQAEVEIGDLTVTGGARFEQIETVGNAISSPIYRQANGVYVDRGEFMDTGLIDYFDNSGQNDKFLPSVVATYRPGDNWVGRFAYNRTIFSPSLIAVNRPLTVVIDQRPGNETATIREGNPELDPEINDNFEIGLERYFGDRPAYVKGAIFYKDISGNITNVLQVAGLADVEDRVNAFLQPLVAVRPDLALSPDTQFYLQRPENGEGGEIYGFELEAATNLDFLPASWPAFLENVQVMGNVTWTEAAFGTDVSARDENGDTISLNLDRPLANQAEWAGNFSVGYEAGGFSGRLLYTYQSELVTSYDEFNLNTIVPEFETLDLMASYTLERGGARYIFFLEGDNLLASGDDAEVTNGTGSYGGEGSPDFFFPTRLQFNGGRTITVGVRATF